VDYTRGKSWHNPRIVPYQKLQLDPIAMVLHYSQQVFEGLKAYHLPDGGVALFRPDRNIARMNASARRMVMPEVDPDLFFRGMKELILLERNWVPKSEGTSLYVRPTMIASEASLGVRPADQYLFYIVLCPVGAYYPEGFNPKPSPYGVSFTGMACSEPKLMEIALPSNRRRKSGCRRTSDISLTIRSYRLPQ
jgi:branched-chain amino acid aminotransferase